MVCSVVYHPANGSCTTPVGYVRLFPRWPLQSAEVPGRFTLLQWSVVKMVRNSQDIVKGKIR